MLSIGKNRAWAKKCGATFDFYARRISASFFLHEKIPGNFERDFPSLPDHPGRPFKSCIALKVFLVWHYLSELGFKRVLVVDDTCSAHPDAPNIFDFVPAGHCGYTQTKAAHAHDSFDSIRKFTAERKLEGIPYVASEYMNGGVMVFDDTMTSMLSLENLIQCTPLLFDSHPHQTLMYYLLKSHQTPIHILPKAFNRIPAIRLPKSERRDLTNAIPHLGDDTYFSHVTSFFRERDLIVNQIADHYLQMWRERETR